MFFFLVSLLAGRVGEGVSDTAVPLCARHVCALAGEDRVRDPASNAGDTHVSVHLRMARGTFVCKVHTQSEERTHAHARGSSRPGHRSALHSALTRVSRGFKEALRS